MTVFDLAAFPRFLIDLVAWPVVVAVVGLLLVVSDGFRQALRLVVAIATFGLGSFVVTTIWLADQPAVTDGHRDAQTGEWAQ